MREKRSGGGVRPPQTAGTTRDEEREKERERESVRNARRKRAEGGIEKKRRKG